MRPLGRTESVNMSLIAAPTRTDALRPAALRVVGKIPVADGVVALDLAALSGERLADWTPGSHIDLILPNGLTRQYSLCGDRFDPHSYRIAVLREPTSQGGSVFIHEELAVGDLINVGGPRNNFPLVPSDRYLFVAGGIGITPLLPMVHQAAQLGADWRLLYGGRRRGSMAFLQELTAYGDRVLVRPEDEFGPLDLADFLGEPREGVRIYACGPDPLLKAIEQASIGWPPHALKVERFVASQANAPVRRAPFEVELARSGKTVTVTSDTTVLEAINLAGIGVLSSCRRGVCGVCETTVLAGRPDHRDTLLDDEEKNTTDCMYICVSRSRDERLVLDL